MAPIAKMGDGSLMRQHQDPPQRREGIVRDFSGALALVVPRTNIGNATGLGGASGNRKHQGYGEDFVHSKRAYAPISASAMRYL
jgi:hypothetical protein